ncbi:MAG: hypothetical protein BJG00_012020 [Limnothrix sp. CACIAM 69d]|nr:MAG: hypothetical protein BJG00_012020 [Limnothrix sp. CACIAM 69d]
MIEDTDLSANNYHKFRNLAVIINDGQWQFYFMKPFMSQFFKILLLDQFYCLTRHNPSASDYEFIKNQSPNVG